MIGVAAGPVLLDGYDALLLDLDGVVYAGGQALPHAVDVLEVVRARGVPIAFVTNNASRTPGSVAELLRSLGVAAKPEEVATAAQAAARLLAGQYSDGANIFVVGGEGLHEAVAAAGLCVVERANESPVAVVQGYGPDVGWRHLAEAVVAIRAGAQWVATNLDPTIPSERGLLPGNGTLVAAVQTALGRGPDAVAGKPARPLHDEAVLRTGGARPLVVGDRLDTDIEGANAVGAASLLVLSGVTSPHALAGAPAHQRPNHVAESLQGLLEPAGSVVDLGKDVSECGGWRARLSGDVVSIDGDGEAVDALRAVCALTWRLADAGQTAKVEPPGVLAPWWG